MNRSMCVLWLSACLAGCGGDKASFESTAHNSLGAVDSSLSTRAPAEDDFVAQEVAQETAAMAGAAQRRIIYTATIELVVKKLSETESDIEILVANSGGHVSEFHQDRQFGDQLQSRWVVRIPVDRFDGFVDAVAEMGVPQSRTIESQEVTKQYRDLESRLNNKKRTEQEFQKLLAERTKSIDDIANIADKLDKVREAIELLEGELRYLSDRIALTTVTIFAREDKDYTPPQAPTFGGKLAETFGGSIGQLLAFGKRCVLFVVAVAPWIPLALVVGIPTWRILRRQRRRSSRRA